ncbi:hypothetical protein KCX82_00745 [Clostridiales bacterium BAD-6]|uniref:Uncharacterized protein n=2 Tax=Sinanaerobacter chloroacetimidivorans TaxID=2818044 RepID=A0A8J8B1M3_9FIRM|nr:hypothetical protein [Sinanaerobacter chloroacetimidivorans]MBR0596395.1 hypothetical protein [Sinanaerobacter chloroacetimidivorans]
MSMFNQEDCDQTGYDFSLKGKVVVLSKSVLPHDHPGQLFFCTGGNGANPNPMGRSVFLVSLSTGEPCRFYRSDVLGTLKPELLPEDEKLQLSQIRPIGALPLESHEPQYSGYSFLQDGRYAAGVWLCSPQEVLDYVEMQKPYQHRILICDRDDFAVMEVVNGQMVFPTPEQMEEFHQGQKGGGMEMQ